MEKIRKEQLDQEKKAEKKRQKELEKKRKELEKEQAELREQEQKLKEERKAAEKKEKEIKESKSEEFTELSSDFESNKGKLPPPMTGNYSIVKKFGRHKSPNLQYVETNCLGIEMEGDLSASARAVFNGKVSGVFQSSFGIVVMVRHGSFITVYAGLSSIEVKTGDIVKTGQTLGKIHKNPDDEDHCLLHFEIRKEKLKFNPEEWIR